ncbi:MAG TPA: protoporphyrinogen oxidase, partial [Chloroflexi bacterium]|nr:protoporphyrinogen oxidase [Chloroflexota bacterium]
MRIVPETIGNRPRAAVIGGGVAGLSAALALRDRGVEVVLIERDSRLGGVVRTDHVDGFLLESGPDSILSYKPSGVAMIDRLG